MKINEVIHNKSDGVVTARADQSVRHLVHLLTEHRIGAVIVSDDGDTVTGIVGERDVVRGLHTHGAELLDQPISAIMDAEVHTCGMDDELATVATDMTRFRTRHLPVMVDGHLSAIVSIGDIVKSRIEQLQTEQEHLVTYLHG